MVGVPTSTGCALCRQRRIKCDQATPSCTQCTRYGRPCPGYKRSYRFQDERPALERKLASQTTHNITLDTTMDTTQQHQSPYDGAPPPHNRPFRQFVAATFPMLIKNEACDFNVAGYIHRDDAPVYQMSAALCLNYVSLGHVTGNDGWRRLGYWEYQTALEETRKNQHSDCGLSTDMLSAVIMLAMYEMWAYTTPDAWFQHARRVRYIMESRGPEAYRTGADRVCYLAFRGFLVLAAVHEDEPCFLDDNEWMGLMRGPGARSSGPGYLCDMFFEEAVRLPRLLSDARKAGGRRIAEVESLMVRIRASKSSFAWLLEKLQQRVIPPRIQLESMIRGAEHALTILDDLLSRKRSDSPGFQYFEASFLQNKENIPRSYNWMDSLAVSMGILGFSIN